MRIVDVLKKKTADNPGTRQPVIAFLGDSITQGCFEVYWKNNQMEVVFDSLSGYPQKVKEILDLLYPQAPVSIVNAGISGGNASSGYERMERDVLAFEPDLLVVCFGLNDCTDKEEGIGAYQTALRQIFRKAKEKNVEVIFMTPNMMNTDSSNVSRGELLEHLAEVFAIYQNTGVFDSCIEAARDVCREEGIPICDCYAIWKTMQECGVSTTRLLSNGLNHPIREMHGIFAWQLVNTMMNM